MGGIRRWVMFVDWWRRTPRDDHVDRRKHCLSESLPIQGQRSTDSGDVFQTAGLISSLLSEVQGILIRYFGVLMIQCEDDKESERY
jgi:hypothetical protein